MTASILYPSITIRLRRSPGTFRHLVRSIVRALRIFFVAAKIFFVAAKFFRPRENLGKKSLGRLDRFRPKIIEIGAILAIFKPFQILKIHMPLLGRLGPEYLILAMTSVFVPCLLATWLRLFCTRRLRFDYGVYLTLSGTSFVRSFVRREIISSPRKFFSSARKFGKKKFGPTRSIPSKYRRNRSHPRDF